MSRVFDRLKDWSERFSKMVKTGYLTVKRKVAPGSISKDEKKFLKERKKRRERIKYSANIHSGYGKFLRWFYGLQDMKLSEA